MVTVQLGKPPKRLNFNLMLRRVLFLVFMLSHYIVVSQETIEVLKGYENSLAFEVVKSPATATYCTGAFESGATGVIVPVEQPVLHYLIEGPEYNPDIYQQLEDRKVYSSVSRVKFFTEGNFRISYYSGSKYPGHFYSVKFVEPETPSLRLDILNDALLCSGEELHFSISAEFKELPSAEILPHSMENYARRYDPLFIAYWEMQRAARYDFTIQYSVNRQDWTYLGRISPNRTVENNIVTIDNKNCSFSGIPYVGATVYFRLVASAGSYTFYSDEVERSLGEVPVMPTVTELPKLTKYCKDDVELKLKWDKSLATPQYARYSIDIPGDDVPLSLEFKYHSKDETHVYYTIEDDISQAPYINPSTYSGTLSLAHEETTSVSPEGTKVRYLQCPAEESISLSYVNKEMTATVTPSNITCIKAGDNITINANLPASSTYSIIHNYTTLETTVAANSQYEKKIDAAAGNHTIKIKNNKHESCIFERSVEIFDEKSPYIPRILSLTPTNVVCKGDKNGKISISKYYASGDNNPDNYLLRYKKEGAVNHTDIEATTSSIEGLEAGTWTVNLINQTRTECYLSRSITIAEPLAPLTIKLEGDPNALCYGDAVPVQLSATGGYIAERNDRNYRFYWLRKSDNKLCIGTYGGTRYIGENTYAVEDMSGCLDDTVFTTIHPEPLVLEGEVTNSMKCFGDTATIKLSAQGGVGSYSYEINDKPIVDNSAVQVTARQCYHWTTEKINGVDVTYRYGSFHVTDGNGCKSGTSVRVDEPRKVSVTTPVVNNVRCTGDNNGEFLTIFDGGTEPYTISFWKQESDGSKRFISYQNIVEDPQYSDIGVWYHGLEQGNYEIGFNDANNCLSENDTTKVIVIDEANEPFNPFLISSNNPKCNGDTNGSFTLGFNGGQSSYAYTIFQGVNSIETQENISEKSITSNAILAAGNYRIKATDAYGCQVVLSEETILENPAPLAVQPAKISPKPTSCVRGKNGSVTFELGAGKGGTGVFRYKLEGDWESEPANFTDLSASTYRFYIQDENGCSAFTDVEVEEPIPIELTTNSTANVRCYGDEIPHSVSWTSSSGKDFSWVLTKNNAEIETGNIGASDEKKKEFEALGAGIYNFSINYINCDSYKEDFEIKQPTAPLKIHAFDQVLSDCKENNTSKDNGSIKIKVEGGWDTEYKNLSWYEVNDKSIIETSNAGEFSISGLKQNKKYKAKYSDVEGCSVDTSLLDFTPPDIPDLDLKIKYDLRCIETSNGELEAVFKQSSNWEHKFELFKKGAVVADTIGIKEKHIFSGRNKGTYQARATNKYKCYAESNEVTLAAGQDPMRLSHIDLKDATCYGYDDGFVKFSLSGGTNTMVYDKWVTPNKVEGRWVSTGISGGGIAVNSMSAGSYTLDYRYNFDNECKQFDFDTIYKIEQPNLFQKLESEQVDSVKCYGEANGKMRVWWSGGVKPFNVIISGSNDYEYKEELTDTVLVVTDLAAGEYSIKVISASGCGELTTTQTIDQPDKLLAHPTFKRSECAGHNGAIILSPTGGNDSEPYKYKWEEYKEGTFVHNTELEKSTNSIHDLRIGSAHRGTVYDHKDCSASVEYEVPMIPVPKFNNSHQIIEDDIICFEGQYAQASLDLIYATSNYKIKVTHFESGNNVVAKTDDSILTPEGLTLNNLPRGTYNATVKNGFGCHSDTSFIIGEGLKPLTAAKGDRIDVSCYGYPSGKQTVDFEYITDGISDFNYKLTRDYKNAYGWADRDAVDFSGGTSDPGTSKTGNAELRLEELYAGDYTLTYWYNHDECRDIEFAPITFTVSEPDQLLWSGGSTVTHNKCFDEEKGMLDLKWEGGVSDFTVYHWYETPEDEQYKEYPTHKRPIAGHELILNRLQTGKHKIVIGSSVMLANGDHCETISKEFTITQPTQIEIEFATTPADCGATNGAAVATVTGGTGSNYKYEWLRREGPNNYSVLSSKQSNISDLDPSKEHGLRVKDDNSCTMEKYFHINTIETVGIILSNLKDITCFEGNYGEITIELDKDKYKYEILRKDHNSNETSIVNNISDQYRTFSELHEGEYSISAQNESLNKCYTYETFFIGKNLEPMKIEEISKQNVHCFGKSTGNTKLRISGDPNSYYYNLTKDGDKLIGKEVVDTDDFQIGSLNQGKYILEAFYNNEECKDIKPTNNTHTFTIEQPQALSLVSASHTDVSCYGGKDGSLTLQWNGGVTGYDIYLNDTKIKENYTGGYYQRTNMSAGTYVVRVVNANGCEQLEQSFEIKQPEPLQLSVSTTPSECMANNATASLTVSGGNGGYSYNWAEVATSAVYPLNGTESTIAALRSGTTYRATVTDTKNCSVQTDFVPEEIPMPEVNINVIKNIECAESATGEVEFSHTTDNYSMSLFWKAAGTDEFTDHSIFDTKTATASGLKQGIYKLRTANGYGCNSDLYFNIGEGILPFFADAGTVNPATCYGTADGHFETEIVGGQNSYAYELWTEGKKVRESETRNGLKIDNLAAAAYQLHLRHNVESCVDISFPAIEFSVGQPEQLMFVDSATVHNLCHDDAKGSFAQQWSGGVQDFTVFLNGKELEKTENREFKVENLTVGEYELRVESAGACEAIETPFLVSEPAQLETSVTTELTNCMDQTGKAQVEVTGGTKDYTYTWSKKELGQEYAVDVQGNLAEGLALNRTYVVRVKDRYNCLHSESFKIDAPEPIVLALSEKTPVLCYGAENGEIGVDIANQGKFNLELWQDQTQLDAISNVETTHSFTDLARGMYRVKVTSEHGCHRSSYVELGKGIVPMIVQTEAMGRETCNGRADGFIDTKVTGGVPPYQYQWSNGATTDKVEGIESGTFLLTATDANGCTEQKEWQLGRTSSIRILSSFLKDPNCSYTTDGTIDLAVDGGVGPYTFNMNEKEANLPAKDLAPGIYDIVITDTKDCALSASFTLNRPDTLTIDFEPDFNLCQGETATLTAPDFASEQNWTSDNGFTSKLSEVSLGQSGKYGLQVWSPKGCTTNDTIQITFFENKLNADFMVATEVFLGDEVVAVNNSEENYSSFKWEIDNAAVTEDSQDFLIFNFNQVGSYEVALLLTDDICKDEMRKTVHVFEKGDEWEKDGNEPLLKKYKVFPNPSTGLFTVLVEFSREVESTFSVVKISNGGVIETKDFEKTLTWQQEFNIEAAPKGQYAVVLVAEGKQYVVQMIKL